MRGAMSEEGPKPSRAEVSNYEIVEHWFRMAAERLELPDDVAAVFSVLNELGIERVVEAASTRGYI